MTRILGILAVAALLVGLLLLSQQQSGPLVVSGFIEADEVRVGSRVGGRVQKVLVSEGDQVSSGETLVELEPFDLSERLAEAQQRHAEASAVHDKLAAGFRPEEIAQALARQKQIQAELDKLSNGPRAQEIAASEASLRLAEAELSLAAKVHQRTETLFGQQSIDKNKLDETVTALRVAQASVDAQSQKLALLQEGSRKEDIAKAAARLEEASQEVALRQKGYRLEDVREAKAKRDSADAAVQAVKRQLEELRITAPSDCVVEAIELQPGDLLSPNMPAVSLVNAQKLRVRAYVPENHLDLVAGQSVRVRIDSFPGRTFAGEIVFIARQAEFTPANVQTPEERSKQVFRIKVRLTDGLNVLRPGMAADVVLSDNSGRQQ